MPNGSLGVSLPTLTAITATAAFLVSGGIWLGQLQTRIDEHTSLMAHMDAERRLDDIESDISELKNDIRATDNLLHKLAAAEEKRHNEVLRRLQNMEYQPYLKEE